MSVAWIILAVFSILLIWIVFIYNQLVGLRNRFKNAFSQIDVQLRRRYDLIPNLVETSKAYLKHERETLQSVIEARNHALSAMKKASRQAGDGKAMKALGLAEGALGQAMLNFNALTEAYPDLKANQTIAQLTEELSSTENRVAFARQAYNDEVMFYNTQREIFPNIIFSEMFGFHEASLFEIENTQVKEALRIHL
ncbi:MAG: LemA family protein [Mariprofundaceae bacterium]|nr:LemA family protein [Mariprofundaceae bacterium]